MTPASPPLQALRVPWPRGVAGDLSPLKQIKKRGTEGFKMLLWLKESFIPSQKCCTLTSSLKLGRYHRYDWQQLPESYRIIAVPLL